MEEEMPFTKAEEEQKIAEQVKARLLGIEIRCPDCGEILTELTRIDSYETRYFLDYDNKIMHKGPDLFKYSEYRCPNCDSLNVDAIIQDILIHRRWKI